MQQTTIPATDAPTDLTKARMAIVVGNQIMSVPADGLGASFGFQPSDPALTSFAGVSWVAGDILYFTGADTAARLAKGTALQELRMNAGATAPEWFTTDATLTSIAGVSWVAGDLGYWSGTDTAARLAKGTAGQVLTMNAEATAPEWQSAPSAATQTEQEAGSSTTVYVSPGRQQFHPSAAKFWAFVTQSGGTPTLQTSYNVTSITDTALGQLTVTIATDFSTANWASLATAGSTLDRGPTVSNKAAGSVIINFFGQSGALQDPGESWNIAGFGDQ